MLKEDFLYLIDGDNPDPDTAFVDSFMLKSGGNYIAWWDFRESYTDKIGGIVATHSATTQDSNGVHFTATNSYIKIPSSLFKKGYTYEIELGECDRTGSVYSGMYIFSYGRYDGGSPLQGYGWTSAGKMGQWGYNSGWQYDNNITNQNYWSNKKLTINIDLNGIWHIYDGKTLIWSTPNPPTWYDHNSCYLGSYGDGHAFYNMVIKSLKIIGGIE